MKYLLATLLLCLCLSAHAQAPETLPSSQRYGWFQTEQWAKDKMLGAPGWRVQSRGTDAGGWQYVLFSDTHYEHAVTYQLLAGRIGGVTYGFSQRSPEGKAWETGRMEQVGANEWVDKDNNARVKRRYDGDMVYYHAMYEPLAKD